jgi:hypothetical protein
MIVSRRETHGTPVQLRVLQMLTALLAASLAAACVYRGGAPHVRARVSDAVLSLLAEVPPSAASHRLTRQLLVYEAFSY